MNWLADIVDQDRLGTFVGREQEVRVFQDWMDESAPPTAVWDVHGIAGMGKSSLLWQWVARARSQDILAVWMDGRSCPRQPADFLTHLYQVCEPVLPLSQGLAGAWPDRWVWIVDNFDELESLESWLREDLVGRIPPYGGLIVFASRLGLAAPWYAHAFWKARLSRVALTPLAYSHVASYFQRMKVRPSLELSEIIHRIHGYPLALAIVGDYVTARGPGQDAWDLSMLESITAELLREVTDPAMHPLLDVLTVVPEVDYELMTQILPAEALTRTRFRALSRLSFVRSGPGGLSLHDVVRAQLFDYMVEYNATGLKRLRIHAVDILAQFYRQAETDGERNHYAYQLIEVLAAAMPSHIHYADLSARAMVTLDRRVSPEDMPALHRMTEEWHPQSLPFLRHQDAHSLLDVVVRNYPDTVRILRDPEQHPLAFFISLPMYQETGSLLEYFVPGVTHQFFPEEPPWPQSPWEADTYFGVMVGAIEDDPRYDPHELLGIIIRDALAFVGRRIRAVLGNGDPQLKKLLTLLGFVSYPYGDDFGTEVFVLDMRHRDFLIWVNSIVRSLNRPVVRAHYEIEDGAVRRSLKALNDCSALAQTDLPQMLGCSAREAQRILTVLLTETPVPPLNTERQRVLRMTYMDRPGHVERLAMSLHLSRPTYYRMLHQGVSDLCTVLRSGDFLAALIDLGE